MVVNKGNRRWETMDKSNLDLTVIIRHFHIHNLTEGKSPRTVEWYDQVLGRFLRRSGVLAGSLSLVGGN